MEYFIEYLYWIFLMTLGIFQWKEGIIYSLFFTHWPAVLKPSREGNRQDKKKTVYSGSFFFFFLNSGSYFIGIDALWLWEIPKLILSHRDLLWVFRDLLMAGNCQVAFPLTSGLSAVVIPSDHYPQLHAPHSLVPAICCPMFLFQGFWREFLSGWPGATVS